MWIHQQGRDMFFSKAGLDSYCQKGKRIGDGRNSRGTRSIQAWIKVSELEMDAFWKLQRKSLQNLNSVLEGYVPAQQFTQQITSLLINRVNIFKHVSIHQSYC